MNEGTIISYKNNSGQIKGDDGTTYAFNRRALGGGDIAQATPGRRVRFRPEGERAREVVLLDAVVEITRPTPKPAVPQPETTRPSGARTPAPQPGSSLKSTPVPKPRLVGAYRFLNPYNFVRWLDRPRPNGHVLGNCSPPPHDRYVGLSGVLICHLANVTPLFISDSHDVDVDFQVSGHKRYQFFRYLNDEGELVPAIPAASLRGMLRAVFEAATNSCLGVFERDEERGKVDRLEHRVNRDPGLVPARVLDVTNGGAVLELFDCTRMAPPVACDARPATAKSGMASAYLPKVLRKRRDGSWVKYNQQGVVSASLHDGERVAALIGTQRQRHRSTRFQWFPVLRIVPAANHATLAAGPDQRKVFGYIHRTGPNIENKHDERLFFRWDDTDPQPQKSYKPEIIKLNEPVVAEYNRSLRKYWERHAERVEELARAGWPENENTLPLPSIFVRKDRKLQKGDLVYYFADQAGTQHICPVTMPRIPYRHPREHLLPQHLHHCTAFESLCPACRTFGWVHEEGKDLEKNAIAAYAGRVRITHGVLKKSCGTLDAPDSDRIPLAILSTPKPTATAFYLLRPDGRSGEADYDQSNARLRGRKFYRHHGKWSELTESQCQEHRRAGNKIDKQNRTVQGVLNPGAEFEFEIHFENLHPLELGALLWSLQLEESMVHRLGFAKALGFGSVKITMERCESLSLDTRYESLHTTVLGEDQSLADQSLIKDFQQEMARIYGLNRFDLLPNISDLHALLSKPAPFLPVHYPRHERAASEDGENFKWFVGNRRRIDDIKRPADKRELPEPQWLALASEDKAGLELMNERGHRIDV